MSAKVVNSEVTRKRMVQLLQILQDWPDNKITSVAISDKTGWKDSLIRHDLWLLGYNKGVSNGYRVDELQKAVDSAKRKKQLMNEYDQYYRPARAKGKKFAEEAMKKVVKPVVIDIGKQAVSSGLAYAINEKLAVNVTDKKGNKSKQAVTNPSYRLYTIQDKQHNGNQNNGPKKDNGNQNDKKNKKKH